MPSLSTTLHLDMLRDSRKSRGILRGIAHWLGMGARAQLYGLEWGDPDHVEPLRYIRDRYVLPYVNSNNIALEIGPGGGRWTRYLTPCKVVYAVDYHEELFYELRKAVRSPNVVCVKNNGCDFPTVPDRSIQFVFSFGVFVHLDIDLIDKYLENLKRIVTSEANIVIQYADKTKVMAQINDGFSDNTPDKMRDLVRRHGYKVLEEDITTLWHSSVIRIQREI